VTSHPAPPSLSLLDKPILAGPDNPVQAVSMLDQIADDLQQLRTDNGCPSYSDIALRIAKTREAQGVAPEAARIARSTVYDCFKTGRTRINPALVGETVLAITGDDEQAAAWVKRCQSARGDSEHKTNSSPTRQDLADQLPGPLPMTTLMTLVVWVACTGGNILLDVFTTLTFYGTFPLYLDMIGTAITSMVLGPWWGVATGVTVNLVLVSVNGTASIPFAIVQVVGALVWGYGVRKFHMAKTLPRYGLLNVIVAAACSLTAVPILLVVFDGWMANPTLQSVADRMMEARDQLVTAIFSVNFLTSLVDKAIAGFIALIVAGTILKRYAPKDLVALTVTPGQMLQQSPSQA